MCFYIHLITVCLPLEPILARAWIHPWVSPRTPAPAPESGAEPGSIFKSARVSSLAPLIDRPLHSQLGLPLNSPLGLPQGLPLVPHFDPTLDLPLGLPLGSSLGLPLTSPLDPSLDSPSACPWVHP